MEWMPPGTVVDDMTVGLPSVITSEMRPHENWKLVLPDIESMMQLICDNCLGFNILRRFHRKCQVLEYLTSVAFGPDRRAGFHGRRMAGPQSGPHHADDAFIDANRNLGRSHGVERQRRWTTSTRKSHLDNCTRGIDMSYTGLKPRTGLQGVSESGYPAHRSDHLRRWRLGRLACSNEQVGLPWRPLGG